MEVSQLQILSILAMAGVVLVFFMNYNTSHNSKYEQCMAEGCSEECDEIHRFNTKFDCFNEYYDGNRVDTKWVEYCCMMEAGE